MSLRRSAATVLTVALTSATLLATTPGANAAPDAARNTACVSKAEYKKVKKGMPQAKVHAIFGTKGRRTSIHKIPGGTVEGRAYKVCTSKKGAAGVSFVKKSGKKAVLGAKAVRW